MVLTMERQVPYASRVGNSGAGLPIEQQVIAHRRCHAMNEHAKPPFPRQKQPMPGRTGAMQPKPDHGEDSYRGCGKLVGKKAIITGADSGIGRTVALAFAREGADVLVAYLNEHDDAKETQRLIEAAGRKAVLVAGDVGSSAFCR